MSYTLTDYIRGFHKLNRAKCFSSSVQSTFLAIACEFDAQGFPDEIELSTRELQLRSGLKSVSTVHEAKNVLKMNRLIDFRTRKKQQTTFFTLCTGHLPDCSVKCSVERSTEHPTEQGSEQSTEHQPNSGLGKTFVCCTQNAGASAEANAGNAGGTCDACNAAPPAPSPTPPPPNPQTTSAISLPAFSSTQGAAHTQDAGEQEAQAIADVWREMTGKPLSNDKDVAELRALDNAHGREIIKVALAEHVRCNGRSFAYFKACLNSTLARLKRGERDGRKAIGTGKQNNSRKLEKPDYSNYPFYKKEK